MVTRVQTTPSSEYQEVNDRSEDPLTDRSRVTLIKSKTVNEVKTSVVSQCCSTRYAKQTFHHLFSCIIVRSQYFSIMKQFAHPAALAYSMTTLGAGMMNSIFGFYYVKLFLNKYKISESAFHRSQVSSPALAPASLACTLMYNL